MFDHLRLWAQTSPPLAQKPDLATERERQLMMARAIQIKLAREMAEQQIGHKLGAGSRVLSPLFPVVNRRSHPVARPVLLLNQPKTGEGGVCKQAKLKWTFFYNSLYSVNLIWWHCSLVCGKGLINYLVEENSETTNSDLNPIVTRKSTAAEKNSFQWSQNSLFLNPQNSLDLFPHPRPTPPPPNFA